MRLKLVRHFHDCKFDEVVKSENTFEWVSNWCTIDTIRGIITVCIDECKSQDAEVYYYDLNMIISVDNDEDRRVCIPKWTLTFLLFEYLIKLYPECLKKLQSTPEASALYDSKLFPICGTDNPVLGTPLQLRLNEPVGWDLNFLDTPLIDIAMGARVTISEEEANTTSYIPKFSWTVGSLSTEEFVALRENMPAWVRQLVSTKDASMRECDKISFQLCPAKGSMLPEFPKDLSRLMANRSIRVKKMFSFLTDRLGLKIHPVCTQLNRSSLMEPSSKMKMIEFICNDVKLETWYTLAAIKQFIWKSNNDVLIHYREVKLQV